MLAIPKDFFFKEEHYIVRGLRDVNRGFYLTVIYTCHRFDFPINRTARHWMEEDFKMDLNTFIMHHASDISLSIHISFLRRKMTKNRM